MSSPAFSGNAAGGPFAPPAGLQKDTSAAGPASPVPPQAPWPNPECPCKFHAVCQPARVDLDPEGDLMVVVGDDSCLLEDEAVEYVAEALPEPRPAGLWEPEPLSRAELALLLTTRAAERAAARARQVAANPPAPQAVAFLACSRAMARASPFFRRRLDGPSAEVTAPLAGGRPTLRLPDDDLVAMKLLLPLVHGRLDELDAFARLPGPESEFERLETTYQLTALSHTYGLTHLLRPWAAELVRRCVLSDWFIADPATLERALWICWELGAEAPFKEAMRIMAWHHPRRPFRLATTDSIAGEAIEKTRLELLTALLRPIKDTLEAAMARAPIPTHGICCSRTSHPTSVCNHAILGSLVQSLCGIHLWPLPRPEDWEASVGHLLRTLRLGLHVQNVEGHGGNGPSCCHRPIRRPKNGQLSWCPQITPVLTALQDKHFRLRGEMLGLE